MSRRPPAPQPEQYGLAPREIVVDLFAGGGGASTGIRAALGRCPDIAIDHSAAAIAMHEANHPTTTHYQCDIWEVDPRVAVGRRKVGLLWASPDCTHFSRAKSGVPKSKRIRSLATVVIRWAAAVRPRVIMLENVPEFLSWGPLDEDGMPIKARAGETFDAFVADLRMQGYAVEWRSLVAADFGAPTSRKRLFLVARCDGRPIVWPDPTHGPGRALAAKQMALECTTQPRLNYADLCVVVRIEAVMPRPKLPKKVGRARLYRPNGADVDNIAKAVLDAMVTAGVIADDRNVARLEAVKVTAAEGELPRVIVDAEPVNEPRATAAAPSLL